MRASICFLFAMAWAATDTAMASTQGASVLEPGHSAVWYDAEKPGTGWVLEMLNEQRGAAYWYGYDAGGQPVWQVGAGTVSGDSENGHFLDVVDLFAGSGARFGNAFDADDVVLERVPGGARFRFADCNEGVVTRAHNSVNSEEEPLNRLTRTMGAGCAPLNGVPGFPVKPYAGQSGTWYNPDRNGEGLTVQWMARDEAVVYWFTYDPDGNPFWLFGVGELENGVIDIPELSSAQRIPNGEVELRNWGNLSLSLECNSGSLAWTSVNDRFGEGTIALTRLNALVSPSCPAVAPGLQELYDIAVLEVSIPEGMNMTVRDISDNGDLLGVERLDNGSERLVFLPAESDRWTALGGPDVGFDQAVLLSPDGQRAIAGEVDSGGDIQPYEWSGTAPGVALPGFAQGAFPLRGASQDRLVLTGQSGNGQPWVWSEESGVTRLPLAFDSESGNGVATAASDDGAVIIGFETFPVITPPPQFGHSPGAHALRWVDGEAEVLMDPDGLTLVNAQVCSADCSIIFGVDTGGIPRDSSRVLQPWFWTESGHFGVFGGFLEERSGSSQIVPAWSPELRDVSSDGSIALGDATSLIPASPSIPSEAFLWTQATGVVQIKQLLETLGADTPILSNAGFRAMGLSGDGLRVLIDDKNDTRVLVLTPKEQGEQVAE